MIGVLLRQAPASSSSSLRRQWQTHALHTSTCMYDTREIGINRIARRRADEV